MASAPGRMVSFPAGSGETEGYVALPRSSSATLGAVVVIQEYWGLNDHVKSIADRLAAEGFAALAPDLYHGAITDSPSEAGRLLMAMSMDTAAADLRGAVSRVAQEVGSRPVGTVGFCMGGALSLFAACQGGAAVGACVVYYGGHPRVKYGLSSLTAPVLGHFASDDPGVNPTVPGLELDLKRQGKSYEFHTYPGTRHGFFNDSRPTVYNRGAADESWTRTLAFFRAHL